MPRMATKDSTNSAGNSFADSVSANGLFRIGRATWVETARWRQERRERFAVTGNEPGQNYARHPIHYLRRLPCPTRARCSSSATMLTPPAAALLRAMTRISVAGGSSARWRRKYSRIRRLMRLRVTELPTLPLTVTPNRFSDRLLARVMITKLAVWNLAPVRDSFKNSARFLKRAVFGNRCEPVSDMRSVAIKSARVSAARSPSIVFAP
jgi:hypothetical protein